MMMLAAQLRRIAGSPGEVPRDPDAARAEIEALLARAVVGARTLERWSCDGGCCACVWWRTTTSATDTITALLQLLGR